MQPMSYFASCNLHFSMSVLIRYDIGRCNNTLLYQHRNKKTCMVSFTSNRKIKATGVMMGYLPLQSPALYLHGGDGASLQPF